MVRTYGRMPEERTVKKVFKNIAVGKRSVGKPRKSPWLMLKMTSRRPRTSMDCTAGVKKERERERERKIHGGG